MKTKYKIIIGIVALLITIRLIMPSVLLHYANDKLAHLPGYYGHVNDIDISLFRGAYSLKDLYLNKVDSTSKKQTQFFKSNSINFSLKWRALFKGAIVGKMALNSPVIIFTKDKVAPKKAEKDTLDIPKLLKSFMPLRLNRFEIHNGELHYVDITSQPKIDVSIKKVHILAINLTNKTNHSIVLPSAVSAQADVYEGNLNFHMKMNLLADHPTFELDAELKSTNLVLLNDFFKAYGKIDVSQGQFGLYTEMAAKDGAFIGYVKPVIKDLKVMGLEDKNNSFLQKSWEALVGAVTFVFKNQKKDQLATKIPIEGKFSDPKLNIICIRSANPSCPRNQLERFLCHCTGVRSAIFCEG